MSGRYGENVFMIFCRRYSGKKNRDKNPVDTLSEWLIGANNAMVYDEAYCKKTLSNAYFGTMHLIEEGGLL